MVVLDLFTTRIMWRLHRILNIAPPYNLCRVFVCVEILETLQLLVLKGDDAEISETYAK